MIFDLFTHKIRLWLLRSILLGRGLDVSSRSPPINICYGTSLAKNQIVLEVSQLPTAAHPKGTYFDGRWSLQVGSMGGRQDAELLPGLRLHTA